MLIKNTHILCDKCNKGNRNFLHVREKILPLIPSRRVCLDLSVEMPRIRSDNCRCDRGIFLLTE